MATLKEISIASGVSIRTVRRVLNKEDHVKKEKAEKVKEVLTRMNYVPNLLARGLRNKRTGIIGVIATQLLLEVRAKKFAAIKGLLSANGYSTMLGLTDGEVDIEKQLFLDYSRFCDGIIFLNDPSEESLEIISQMNTPYVIPDSEMNIDNAIAIDRESGIIEAIKSQYKNYESIFFVDNFDEVSNQRVKAFNKGVLAVGAKKVKVFTGKSMDFNGGVSVGENLSKEINSLTICYNDRVAAGLLKSFYHHGCDVPNDFGIIGFDNDDFTQYTHKSISTVTQSVDELAEKTFKLLDAQINGEKIKKMIPVKTKFLARESTL